MEINHIKQLVENYRGDSVEAAALRMEALGQERLDQGLLLRHLGVADQVAEWRTDVENWFANVICENGTPKPWANDLVQLIEELVKRGLPSALGLDDPEVLAIVISYLLKTGLGSLCQRLK